jgi:hypothetical protein
VAEEPAASIEAEFAEPIAAELVIAEPEPVEEPVAEAPVAADEPVLVEEPAEPATELEPAADAEPEPLISDEVAGDLVAALAGDAAPAETEMDTDDLSSFGIGPLEPTEEPVAAATEAADWSESPIEEFDAPKPDELVTSTPEADPFMDDLFGESAAAAPDVDEPPAPPAPVEEEIPVSSAPAGDAPSVDRAAVVRELAGLFSDDERPRARPSAPRPAASGGEGDERKRVEDDDDVTKGIISRLIDGVKGL